MSRIQPAQAVLPEQAATQKDEAEAPCKEQGGLVEDALQTGMLRVLQHTRDVVGIYQRPASCKEDERSASENGP